MASDLLGLYALVRSLGNACLDARLGLIEVPEPLQAADFAAWQRDHLTDARLGNARSYWQRMHGDRPLHVKLFGRQAVQRRDRSSLRALTAALPAAFAQCRNRTSLACLALARVAARHSDDPRPTIALPVMNRSSAEAAEIVGFLANTLPVRIDTDPQRSTAELLQAAKCALQAARAYEDVPYAAVMNGLLGSPNIALNYFPNMRRRPLASGFEVYIPGLPPAMATPFDMSLYVLEEFGCVTLQYFGDNLDDARAAQLLDEFTRCLCEPS